MSYATKQGIRQTAGLLNQNQNELAAGVTDASNLVFSVSRRPFVDGSGDDEIKAGEDVKAFVDGIPATITGIDAATGSVTLQTAPAANSEVTIDYYFSPADDDYVDGKESEAESWVNTKLKGIETTPFKGEVPGTISTITELYAAGLILIRDYGNNTDTDLTSKDGSEKIKTARALMDDYIAGVKADKALNNTNGDTGSVSVATDGDVFSRRVGHICGVDCDSTNDECFMRPRIC